MIFASPINAIATESLLFMPPDKLLDGVPKSYCKPTNIAIRSISLII